MSIFSLYTGWNKKLFFCKIYKKKCSGFSNLMEIEFSLRRIFKFWSFINLPWGHVRFHTKNWARTVQPFKRLLDTNKLINTQAKYIFRFRNFETFRLFYFFFTGIIFPYTLSARCKHLQKNINIYKKHVIFFIFVHIYLSIVCNTQTSLDAFRDLILVFNNICFFHI